MKKTIIIIGLGEIGRIFAQGFLKLGYPVQGVTREMSLEHLAQEIPNPEAILIAVGETDLPNSLATLPPNWTNDVVLIQNELLPKDWQNTQIKTPTVASIWFEKKKEIVAKQVMPSPVYGPHANLVKNALAQMDLEAYEVTHFNDLQYELVRKNLYILTTNIAGLKVGGTVSELAQNHSELMQAIANEVILLQDALTQSKNNSKQLMLGLAEAFKGDPNHKCMGRTAKQRLERAFNTAQKYHLSTPCFKEILNSLHE